MNSERIACNSCGYLLSMPTWASSTRRECEKCGKSMFIARLSGDVTIFPDHNSDENQTCILLPCEESTIGSHITPKAWLSAIADQKGKVRRLVPWRTCLIAGNMYDAQTGRLVGHASASHLTSEDRKYHQLESIGDEVDIGKGCTKPIFCDKHDRSFQCVDDRPTSTDFENWGDVQAELMVIRSWAMDMMRDAHHQLHRPYILGGYDRNVFIPGEDIIYDGDRLKLQADYRYETKILDKPGMLAGTAFYYGPDDWISMSFIPVGARKGTQKEQSRDVRVL